MTVTVGDEMEYFLDQTVSYDTLIEKSLVLSIAFNI